MSVWNEGEEALNFTALCLPAHAALTLYNLSTPAGWLWSSPPIGDLSTQPTQPFTLVNSRPIALELKINEISLNRFEAPRSLIESGISINRAPDTASDGVPTLHSDIPTAAGALSSPGRCVQGNRFEQLCQP